MGFSNFVTSLIVALPFLLAMGVMFAWGKSSDVKGERVWHVAIPLLLTGAGFVIAWPTVQPRGASCAQRLDDRSADVLRPVLGYELLVPRRPRGGGRDRARERCRQPRRLCRPQCRRRAEDATGSYVPGMLALALALAISAAAVFMLGRAIRLRGSELARQDA